MRQSLDGVPVSLGVDWLTCTQSSPDLIERLRQSAFAIAEVEMAAGFFGRPCKLSGYDGFSVGGLDYGERYDGAMVRLRGVVAQSHWRPFYALASNVTRIDVQATFRTTENPAVVIRRHRRQLQAKDRTLKCRPRTSYRVSRTGGMTVYSGSRQSDQYLRIYDKGDEDTAKLWCNTVRYELEVKGARSKLLSSRLYRMRSEHVACAQTVLAFCSKRGASVTPLLASLKACASKLEAIKLPARVSDLEKTSAWLQKAVTPSVQSVCSRTNVTQVLSLLGLSDLAIAR